jgi:hypothetical protein
VVLGSRGPCVDLRLDLKEFPAAPPRKWVEKAANQVQIVLSCFASPDVKVECWDGGLARLSISKVEDKYVVKLSGDGTVLSITCAFVSVKKVSAHQTTFEWPP